MKTIRKFTFAAAAAFLMAGAVHAATIGGYGWTRVAPPAGKFSAVMPGNAEYTTSRVGPNIVNSTMHSYQATQGGYVYAVYYGDLTFVPANVRQMLDAVRDGNAQGGRVISESEFTFNGLPGKAVTIEKGDAVVYNRILVVHNRIYQVMFLRQKSSAVPESANTFITSFRLTD